MPSALARSQYSTIAIAAAAAASSSVATGGRNQTTPITIGISSSALRTRDIKNVLRATCHVRRATCGTRSSSGDRRMGDAAVAAIALLIREDGFEQVPLAEVRPERLRDPDLGIGNLPQEEIADAHFSAGADEQIRIGLAGGVEKACEALFVELLSANAG